MKIERDKFLNVAKSLNGDIARIANALGVTTSEVYEMAKDDPEAMGVIFCPSEDDIEEIAEKLSKI